MRDQRGRIYLDYHATTPVDPRVADVVARHMLVSFGNAGSADHVFGDEAAAAVDAATASVGALVGGRAVDVLFTSGATESINMVLKGLAARAGGRRLRIAASPTEHSAVLHSCEALVRAGIAEVTWLRVDGHGHVDMNEIEQVFGRGCDVVCVMAANNEIGTIAPFARVAALAQQHGVAYLCDASQAGGRVLLESLGALDAFVVLSAHKMYGPRGVGALVSSRLKALGPLIHGGEQQRGLRGGTLNVPGIAGFGEAARLRREEMGTDESRVAQLRDDLQGRLLAGIPHIAVNGDPLSRLAGNLHVSVTGIPNGAVVARVRDRLAIATGAACASGIEAPSHVLRAIGLEGPHLDGALRIGLGRWTTSGDVEEASALLIVAVRAIAQLLTR